MYSKLAPDSVEIEKKLTMANLESNVIFFPQFSQSFPNVWLFFLYYFKITRSLFEYVSRKEIYLKKFKTINAFSLIISVVL